MGLKYINKALNLPVSASWLALLAQTVSNIHSPIVASSASCLNLRSCSTRCRKPPSCECPTEKELLTLRGSRRKASFRTSPWFKADRFSPVTLRCPNHCCCLRQQLPAHAHWLRLVQTAQDARMF